MLFALLISGCSKEYIYTTPNNEEIIRTQLQVSLQELVENEL